MTAESTSPPQVGVIVATRNREHLLQKTIDGIVGQDFDGDIELILVYDQADPRLEHVSSDQHRSIRVVCNTRTPGLAGARNTGILATTASYVAFCDDDDVWRPSKLSAQLDAMRGSQAIACVTGIRVTYEGLERVRVPETNFITVTLLARSRLTGAHPSSYLVDRERVLKDVGLVDEELPGGYGEDYDWLLRLAAAGTVTVVRAPLVDVLWHRGSYFTNRWQTIIEALEYLVVKHPEIASNRAGRARILGQQAFATAALGAPVKAVKLATRAALQNPREPRSYVSVLVACKLISADTVVHQANRRGRGI